MSSTSVRGKMILLQAHWEDHVWQDPSMGGMGQAERGKRVGEGGKGCGKDIVI